MAAAQLTPQALKALDEAAVLLRQTSGFMYVPILAASERAASLAVDAIRPAMAAEPFPVAWPAPRSNLGDTAQATAELDEDLRQLLTNLDEAIAKLPTNAVLLLNATSSARSALATRVTTHLNLRREPLRTAQLRFLLLWPAELREALMAGAPDLWSMRSVSPWADEVNIPKLLNEPAEVHATANGEHVLPGTLSNAMQQRLQSWRRYRNFSEADLSAQDALALIQALYLNRQCVTALEIAERLQEILNDDVGDTAKQDDRAATYSWVAALRGTLGDRRGALAPAQEAVAIYRRLSQAHAAAYEPSLAMGLNNLARTLSDLGDHQGALATAQEALAKYRRLSHGNTVAYESDLAASLNNLTNSLSDLGDHQGALVAAQEALAIRRHLAQANAAAYEPGLAGSLNNLANKLRDLGDRQGALVAAQEALAILRRLAQTNAATYEPDLAMSLSNLAGFMSGLGDHRGALVPAYEALAIRHRLAQANPADYEADLAQSLNNLAGFMSLLGRRQDALDAAQDAVAIYRRLAQANPAAHEPDLAKSLGIATLCFAKAEDIKTANALGTEALALFTSLAQTNPTAFEQYREMTEWQLSQLRPY